MKDFIIGTVLFIILMVILYFTGVIPDAVTTFHKIIAIGGSLATLGLPLWKSIYNGLRKK